MNYAIGDTVVHWSHGLGKVIAIDHKDLSGISQQYYVIKVELLTLWVPVEEAHVGSIRLPIESIQFKTLFEILRTPGKLLPDNQYQRKTALRERMQKRTLEDLCHVIRDLTDRSRAHPLNHDDASVLFLNEEHLLDEWALVMGVERANALDELEVLLRIDSPQPMDQAVKQPPRRPHAI
jgi:CarD family transcriptional regulator